MEHRTITVNGQQIRQHKTSLGVWVIDSDIDPITTNEKFVEPNILQLAGPKRPTQAPQKLVRRGGRRKLVRPSMAGKSLKKEYADKEKAIARRLSNINRKVCEQTKGEGIDDGGMQCRWRKKE